MFLFPCNVYNDSSKIMRKPKTSIKHEKSLNIKRKIQTLFLRNISEGVLFRHKPLKSRT